MWLEIETKALLKAGMFLAVEMLPHTPHVENSSKPGPSWWTAVCDLVTTFQPGPTPTGTATGLTVGGV